MSILGNSAMVLLLPSSAICGRIVALSTFSIEEYFGSVPESIVRLGKSTSVFYTIQPYYMVSPTNCNEGHAQYKSRTAKNVQRTIAIRLCHDMKSNRSDRSYVQ